MRCDRVPVFRPGRSSALQEKQREIDMQQVQKPPLNRLLKNRLRVGRLTFSSHRHDQG
jgi:hypothetical protein